MGIANEEKDQNADFVGLPRIDNTNLISVEMPRFFLALLTVCQVIKSIRKQV